MAEDRSVLSRASREPDLLLRYGDGAGQVADGWVGPGGARGLPLVVLLHGGFWRPEYDRAHVRPMGEALCGAGWSVVSVEYRRVPGEPGSATGDVRAALDLLPELFDGPQDGSMIVVGHSAGGHLALWASAAGAAAPALRATVALAPVADLRLAHRLGLDGGAVADFLGVAPGTRPDLDPARGESPAAPTVIFHGLDDRIVPIALSESYVTAHPSARLAPLPGAGHFALIDPLTAAWARVLSGLRALSADHR
ncbi:alpha/beta hydrolase [Nonomuraea lactucae]|uniref:alpha/beta hydrolase n=1 Tax=Nonomuraea lactucae TaxID=2249762 RepID=UPI000DE3D634|nr:alpha/beta hydrolase [Nonomuraea lactucae]